MSRALIRHDAAEAAGLLADDPDLQPTLAPGEFDERFLALHRQLFRTDEPEFHEVTTHVFRPPAPYHVADHQFLWDGSRWHLLYVTGDISRIDAYRRHMEAGRLDEAAAQSPEIGIGHARGDSLGKLSFHRNLLLPSQGEFDKVTRGVPYCFRYRGRWGMLYEVRGEGGDHQSLAWSDDVEDWTQDADNPAFGLPSWGPNPGGAAQDVCVLRRPGGLYLIFFKSRAGEGQVAVGLNATRDFRTFVELGPVFRTPPMLRGTIGLESPCVVERDGMWHLFFTLGPGTWHAVSDRPTGFLQGGTYWRVGTGSYLLPLPRRRGVRPRRPLVPVDHAQGAVAAGEPPAGASLLPGHLRGRDRPGGRGLPQRNRVGRRPTVTGKAGSDQGGWGGNMSTVATGLWHFSYTVRDLDRSIDFYCRLIGMELVHRQRGANPYTARLVAYADADIDVAMLRIPDCPVDVSGHHLELVQYLHPAGAPIDTATNRPGVAHLAFMVDDIHAMYDRLVAEGVRFKGEPVAIEEGRNKGGFAVYFNDFDGIPLELLQPPASAR